MASKKVAAGTGPVVADPPFAEYAPLSQDSSHHTLRNPTGKALAVKVKCSDNAVYRVRPVFAVIPPQSSVPLDVARASEPPKHDKLVIQSLECAADEGEGQVELLFKAPGVAPLFNTIRLKCGDDPVSTTTRSTKSSRSRSAKAAVPAAEPKSKSAHSNSKAQASQKKRDEAEEEALRKKKEEEETKKRAEEEKKKKEEEEKKKREQEEKKNDEGKKKAFGDKSKKDMSTGPAVKQHDLPGHEKKQEIVHLGLKDGKKEGLPLLDKKKHKDAPKKK